MSQIKVIQKLTLGEGGLFNIETPTSQKFGL